MSRPTAYILTLALAQAIWVEPPGLVETMLEQAPHNELGPSPRRRVCWRPDVLPDIVPTDMTLEGGRPFCGGTPGLGVELDEDAALAHPYEPGGLQLLRRDDGSVSD